MSCKTFYIFLIIIVLFIIIKSDVPVHCTSDQSFGKWKFHIYGELFKPILYYNAKENEEAWFSVMSGKTSYRYVLRK